MPVQKSDIVERIKLLEVLDTFNKYKLILLTAPAGYGKTTLLISWQNSLKKKYKGKKEPLLCWLNLDEQDNNEDVFFSYFFFTFYNNPGISNQIKEIAIKKFGGCNSFHQEHFLYFLNDVSKINQEIIIIIDNFHFINNKKIQQSFKMMMEYMPSNLHIFLSGREIPKIKLAKQKMYGTILDIRERELAFSYEETKKFCNHILKSDNLQIQVTDIYKQTQGWPAGVQLMVLSIFDRKDRKNFDSWMAKNKNTNLGNHNQILYDFFMEEIFSNLPEKYKKFLINTSLPKYFTISQSKFLLDIPDVEVYIEKIKEKRLFSSYTDNYLECFQYHPMFREFLLAQFSLQDELLKVKIYKKLILWYEQNKQWNEAINYSIKGKEFNRAVLIIEKISIDFGYRGQAHILDKYNQLLPSDYVMSNPRLLLNSAWAASSEGKRKKVQIYLDKLSMMKLSSEMKTELIALSSSNLSPLDDNLELILQDCKEAVKDLTKDLFLSELLYFNIGIIYLFMGNLADSRLYFEKCYKSSLKTGRTYLSVVSNQAIVRFYMQQGQFKKAEWETTSLLMQIEEKEEVILPIKGILFAILAEIQLKLHKPEEALKMAKLGLSLGKFGEDYWVIGENLLIMAKIYHLLGDREKRESILKELEYSIKGRLFFDLEIKYGLFMTEKKIEEGQLENLKEWFSYQNYMCKKMLSIIYPEFVLLENKLKRKELYFQKKEENICLSKESLKGCSLSYREQEILKLIQQGYSNTEIAEQLVVSINTVKTHIQNIFEKLGVHNRWKAVSIAEQMRLIY